jgi:hypothetical protein
MYIVRTFITMFNVYNLNIFYIIASDVLLQKITLTKDRPVLWAPRKDKTVTV